MSRPVAITLNERREFITRLDSAGFESLGPGVDLCAFASGAKGAKNLFTGLARLEPKSGLPYHTHPCGEVILPLSETCLVDVESRRYLLSKYDAIYIPADCPHAVQNMSPDLTALVHVSFADASPDRDLVNFSARLQEMQESPSEVPESLVRFSSAKAYELAPQTQFRDLFASRFGSSGVCGGFGRFEPGSSLPCHVHNYDESISIVEGTAICQVAGKEYTLSNNETACIPRGRPHRFSNRSKEPMAMIWVYAGDEPDRDIVDQSLCEGICIDNV